MAIPKKKVKGKKPKNIVKYSVPWGIFPWECKIIVHDI